MNTLLWFKSSLSGCKTIAITGILQVIFMHIIALKLTIFEVANFAPDLGKVIHMFSLDFINNYAIFKVVWI